MAKQVFRRKLGVCGIGSACLALAGCANFGHESEKPGRSEAPSGTNVVVESVVTHAPPEEGYDWDVLARMAAANCAEAKALLLDAQGERHQTAVDTAWRNPQLRFGHHEGEEDEISPGRTGMQTFPDEVNMPSRPFTRYRETGERSFDGDTVGLRVYTANPFVNRWLRRRGEASARAIEAEADEEAYAIFCEVRTLCLEAEMLNEEISLLEQMAALRKEVRDYRKEQADAGVANALDLIRSETRWVSLRSEIREKQIARQQLVRQIALLAKVPAGQVRLRPPEFSRLIDPARLEVSALTDLAFLRRPDLLRATREKEAAQHGVKAAKAGHIPWLEYIEGTYEEESAEGTSSEQYLSGYDTTSQDETEWQVRVAVTLPVFNWLGDEVKRSRSELAAAETRAEGVEDKIRSEVSGVLADFLSAREARDQLSEERQRVQATMTKQIDALAKEATVKYEEVLSAREELVAYRRFCMKAEREYLRMAQFLETVSGGSLAAER